MKSCHPENLLEHGPFLRSVAGALVRDAHDTEDVMQDAYTAALAGGPRDGWSLPEWLCGVARNLARRTVRSRKRRLQREQAVAQMRTARSAADVVELEEVRQRVVQAVLALREPYRTVVLMRYYDDLAPREIAARLGLPAATVRSHLHRALAQLRAQLDRTQREGRTSWATVLLTIAEPRRAAVSSGVGGLTVVMTMLSLLGIVWLSLLRDIGVTQAATNAVRTASTTVAAPDAGSAPLAALVGERQLAAGGVPQAVPTSVPQLSLRFAAPNGQLLDGAAVRAAFEVAATAPTITFLDADRLEVETFGGRIGLLGTERSSWTTTDAIRLADDGVSHPVVAVPAFARVFLVVARPGTEPFVSQPIRMPLSEPVELEVRVPDPATLVPMRFVAHETQQPLVDAKLRFYVGIGSHLAYVLGTEIATDRNGVCRFLCEERGAEEPFFTSMWVESPEFARLFYGQPDLPQERVLLVPRRVAVEGTAPSSTGTIVMQLSGPELRTHPDSEGAFRFDGVPMAIPMLHQVDLDARRLISMRVPMTADATVHVDFRGAEGGATLVGRITVGATPLAHCSILAEVGEVRFGTSTDVNGQYVLTGLPGAVEIEVQFPIGGRVHSRSPISLPERGSKVVDFDLPAASVQLRVIDRDGGEPMTGVTLQAKPHGKVATGERFPGFDYYPRSQAVSDGEGLLTIVGVEANVAHLIEVREGNTSHATGVVVVPGHGFASQPVEVRIAPR